MRDTIDNRCCVSLVSGRSVRPTRTPQGTSQKKHVWPDDLAAVPFEEALHYCCSVSGCRSDRSPWITGHYAVIKGYASIFITGERYIIVILSCLSPVCIEVSDDHFAFDMNLEYTLFINRLQALAMEGNSSPDDWVEGLHEVERIHDRIKLRHVRLLTKEY
ncbi:hypothetical protein KIN20_019572 [Parelaphostrongylus tenuis]|uniref:Uncharacterized protein n=1 Tax=Parelaphostrongylus tenuis TaxID=148309 RepID=A0AAD5MLE9_PARTN|nr:hypothetical protein KIN20_019572 [Parelaphostrongylus tenuis]